MTSVPPTLLAMQAASRKLSGSGGLVTELLVQAFTLSRSAVVFTLSMRLALEVMSMGADWADVSTTTSRDASIFLRHGKGRDGCARERDARAGAGGFARSVEDGQLAASGVDQHKVVARSHCQIWRAEGGGRNWASRRRSGVGHLLRDRPRAVRYGTWRIFLRHLHPGYHGGPAAGDVGGGERAVFSVPCCRIWIEPLSARAESSSRPSRSTINCQPPGPGR